MSRAFAFAAMLALALPQALAQTGVKPPANAQILAFVEELEGEARDSSTPAAMETKLRLGFARLPQGWLPICAIAGMEGDRPQCMDVGAAGETRWRVIHRGAAIGEVRARGFYDPSRPNLMGALDVAGEAPRVGAPSAEYAGWMGAEVRRPLLAMRRPHPVNARGWASAPIRRDDLAAVVKLFSRPIPNVPNCKQDPTAPAGPPLAPEHWKVFASYASTGGERLFGVQLDRALAGDCEGALTLEWSDFWFHAKPRGAPELVDLGLAREQAIRMRLIELGDFDGDGKVEALFWQAAPNEDGYVLLQDGFTRTVKAIWNYH